MVYILIPSQVYDSFTETDFAWFNNDFCQKVKSLFSFRASTEPLITSKGALSPPNASTKIFILIF